GAVSFADNGNPIACTGGTPTLSNGGASCTTSALPVGDAKVAATYQGDTNFATSTTASALTQTVNQAPTTTVLSGSPATSVFGQPVTFAATVTATPPGSGTPTGAVQLVIDGTNSGSPVGLSAGKATIPGLSSLSVGTHTITASYQGDASFLGSTTGTALSQAVRTAASTTTVFSSSNP